MNQTLDKQAILAHYRGELAGVPVVFAATSSDKRVIDLVAQFNAADERGRNTMLRMAQVMPKGDK